MKVAPPREIFVNFRTVKKVLKI
jgi:hypothetical protein